MPNAFADLAPAATAAPARANAFADLAPTPSPPALIPAPAEEPDLVERSRDLVSRAARGILQGTARAGLGLGRIREGANRLADLVLPDSISRPVLALASGGVLGEFKRGTTKEAMKGAEELADLAKFYTPNPSLDRTLAARVIDLASQAAPVLATGVAAPLVAGAQMGENARQEAIDQGLPQSEADRRFGVNAAGGTALGLIPIPFLNRIPGRLTRATAGILGGATVNTLGDIALQKATTGEVNTDNLGVSAALGAAGGFAHGLQARPLRQVELSPRTPREARVTPPAEVNMPRGGVAPAEYIGNNILTRPNGESIRSELFRATEDIPELEIKKGGTVGRDRLESAGYHVPETPILPDGEQTAISLPELAKAQADMGEIANQERNARAADALAESVGERSNRQALAEQREVASTFSQDSTASRAALAAEEEAAREAALRQSAVGRTALARDLEEGRSAFGQSEPVPRRSVPLSLVGPEPIPPVAAPLPNEAVITVMKGGGKSAIQIDLPDSALTPGMSRSRSPEQLREMGYYVPDLSHIPEGKVSVGRLRDYDQLPGIQEKTTSNATQERQVPEGNLRQHQEIGGGRPSTETGRSDLAPESGQIQPRFGSQANEGIALPKEVVRPSPGGLSAASDIRAPRQAQPSAEPLPVRNRDLGYKVEQKIPEEVAPNSPAHPSQNHSPIDWSPSGQPPGGGSGAGGGGGGGGPSAGGAALPAPGKGRTVASSLGKPGGALGLVSDLLAPISTRIRKISPAIYQALTRYETRMRTEVADYKSRLAPFFAGTKKLLSKADREQLDLLLKNEDMKGAENLIRSYSAVNPGGVNAVLRDFATARGVFADLLQTARTVGIDSGELEQFWPRAVKRDTLNEYKAQLGSEDAGALNDALAAKRDQVGRALTHDEEIEIANQVARGQRIAAMDSRPSQFKERKVAQITPDNNKYYEKFDQSALTYVERVVNNIEKRRLFGRDPSMLDGSVGALMADLRQQGRLTGDQQNELKNLFAARFGLGESGPAPILRKFRDISNIASLGSPISAIGQLPDLAATAVREGVWNTAKGLVRRPIKLNDLGLENIAEEFADRGRTGKVVREVFKRVGFEALDRLGKETNINAAFNRLRREARTPVGINRLQAEWGEAFGPRFNNLVSDLRAGRVSEDVRVALFSRLSDVQPISLSEMPLKYLQNPNGRLAYMLKTYTVKQLDMYRRDIAGEFARGNPATATKNLVKYAAFLTAANVGINVVKDTLLNRDIDPEEVSLAAALNLIGINRYTLHKAKDEGVGSAILQTTLPPASLVDAFSKDLLKGTDLSIKNSELIQYFPGIGRFIYWGMGKGYEKTHK